MWMSRAETIYKLNKLEEDWRSSQRSVREEEAMAALEEGGNNLEMKSAHAFNK